MRPLKRDISGVLWRARITALFNGLAWQSGGDLLAPQKFQQLGFVELLNSVKIQFVGLHQGFHFLRVDAMILQDNVFSISIEMPLHID
jgi:hypothetical protein